MMKTRLAFFSAAIAFGLSACSTTETGGTFAGDDVQDTDAVLMTPINDVGLDDIEIPTYLSEMTDPYAFAPGNCAAARAEVRKLDELLGSDLDVGEDEDERRTQLRLNASSSAIGSVLIPFRGVVRAISGAAKNEREAREAYQRGLVRRAYIKGRAEAVDCAL
ncbi:MAG: hypothetical protein AAF311_09375 [Pseudomonadota bacterium]